MSDILLLYYYLADGLFIGFSIVTVLLLAPYRFFGKELQMHVGHFIQSSTKVMPYIALLYFIVILGSILQSASDGSLHKTEDFYLDAYFMKVVVLPLIICLLWIKQVTKRRWIVLCMAVMTGFFFIGMNQRFIIFLTMLHRDYLPPSVVNYELDVFYFFGRFILEQIIIFCVLIIPIHFYRIKKIHRGAG